MNLSESSKNSLLYVSSTLVLLGIITYMACINSIEAHACQRPVFTTEDFIRPHAESGLVAGRNNAVHLGLDSMETSMKNGLVFGNQSSTLKIQRLVTNQPISEDYKTDSNARDDRSFIKIKKSADLMTVPFLESQDENRNGEDSMTTRIKDNIQTSVDQANNVRIQFSRSPNFPFVGNVTRLSFHIMNADSKNGLNHAFVHVALFRNASEELKSSHSIVNSGPITFENHTDGQGNISAKYSFPAAGLYQIIVRTTIIEGRASLSSFSLPVLKYWWDLF